MHIQLARCSPFPLFCSSSFSVCRRELNPVLCAGCCCCWLINNTHGRTATQLLFDFLLHCFVFLGNYFDAVSLCVNSRNFHEPLRHTRAFIANICWRLLWLSGSQTWNSLVDDNAPNAVEITITSSSGHCDDSLAVFSFSQTMVYFLQIHLIRYRPRPQQRSTIIILQIIKHPRVQFHNCSHCPSTQNKSATSDV